MNGTFISGVTMRARLSIIISSVLILCLLFSAGASERQRADNHFYFVQISDTHWGALDGISATRRIVEAINALPMQIACVVHTGDLFADSIENQKIVEEGRAALTKLKVPILFVPGNHDISREKFRKDAVLFQKNFGPLATNAVFHGVVFLGLCTEPLRSAYEIQGFNPLDWLSVQVRAAADHPILLFIHAPPVPDFHRNAFSDPWPNKAGNDLEAIIKGASSIKAVIAGHFHRDEFHWIGNVPLYVCEPVARFWERQPAFRIYEYTNGRLGYRTIYLDSSSRKKDGIQGSAVEYRDL